MIIQHKSTETDPSISLPWQAWYGDRSEVLTFPDGWDVIVAYMPDAHGMEQGAIKRVLANPIGTLPLKDLAKKHNHAAIVIEDISRPTPTATILPSILAVLQEGGLNTKDVHIIIGLGAHPPMGHLALKNKLGKRVLENFNVYQHQPYENLEHLGTTQRGTPVCINRFFLQANLRIGLGSITPHVYTGFGGGSKIVAIGLGGIDTLEVNHNRAREGEVGIVGSTASNETRTDIEEIAQIAGLNFIINSIVNSRRELSALFVGDPVQAHRSGMKWARRVYATELPPKVDIAIFNSYPKDTDLIQSINALNAVGFDLNTVLKENGTAVITSACSEGVGLHFLQGVGMRSYVPYNHEKDFRGHNVILYSPNITLPEVRQYYPHDTLVFSNWGNVVKELLIRHGSRTSVVVFPCASLQFPASEISSQVFIP